jgi:hypothetical protein
VGHRLSNIRGQVLRQRPKIIKLARVKMSKRVHG